MNWTRYASRVVQWRESRLSILIFHQVLQQRDPLFPDEPDAVRFEAVLRFVADAFRIMPLAQAATALREGTLPPGAMAITFDDGYADNETVAAPILKRLGLHATFFVANGFLDGGRMWNDTVVEALRRTRVQRLDLSAYGLGVHVLDSWAQRRQAIDLLLPKVKYLPLAQRQSQVEAIASACGEKLPDDLMMSSRQLQDLRRSGMGIGGHTVSHPILCSVPDDEAQAEIRNNKAALEAALQEPVTLFAYPNGKPDADYAFRHTEMVRAAGYQAAVSTAPGASSRGSDLMQLPRYTPWDQDPLRFSMRLVANLRQQARLASQASLTV
jgi:peptidoglycan/xylan/chitin deacetylase (PgdA/CDA1 family)